VECDFKEVDLTEANFAGSVFRDTLFHQANLQKADFRSAQNYSIDPRNNNVNKARFAQPDVLGLLAPFGILVED
jgi:uncharacterized protein YjbI with pentapeptide repeats